MMTYLDVFLIFFEILALWVVWFCGGRGLKRQNMAQNDKTFRLTSYLKNCTSYDCGFWYTCVKWWYLQQTFSFFQKSGFSGFSKFINKCQKKILTCVSPYSHVCDFVPIGVIKDRIIKMYPKYLNGKLWSYHLSCFINPFLYDQAKVKIGDHFLSFRFDIGVCNNGFVSITKLKNGRINLRITNLW